MNAIEIDRLRSLHLRIIPTFAVASLMIQAAAAQQPATPEVLEYKGTVAAARQAEVAPRLDGLLLKINFTSGQLVKKGDLLFEFALRTNVWHHQSSLGQ